MQVEVERGGPRADLILEHVWKSRLREEAEEDLPVRRGGRGAQGERNLGEETDAAQIISDARRDTDACENAPKRFRVSDVRFGVLGQVRCVEATTECAQADHDMLE